MAFQQADYIPNTTISQTAIQDARTAWSQGQYGQAWQILADAGDRYADNAASVIAGTSPSGQFFHELVKNHWENTIGIDVYNTKFQAVAKAHLNNYLTELKDGYIPSTQDILNSYQSALTDNDIPTIVAFDVAWAKAFPGTTGLGDSSWAVGLAIDPSRITTSNTDSNIPSVLANAIIAMDFWWTFDSLGKDKTLDAIADLLGNGFEAISDYFTDLLGGSLDFIIPPAYGDNVIENVKQQVTSAKSTSSPIILDLNNNGVETTGVKQGAYFDHANDGFAEQTGWVGANDGLLVRDLNGNRYYKNNLRQYAA